VRTACLVTLFLLLGFASPKHPAHANGAASPAPPPTIGLRLTNRNPARTNVSFAIDVPPGAASGPVALDIFDLSGRRVRALVSRLTGPGTHMVVWDLTADSGARVPVGLYFARLQSGEAVVRRLVVLTP
jgi:hypothetical protein